MTEEYATNLRARFDAKYIPEPMSGCWLWTAALTTAGYGMIGTQSDDGEQIEEYAHRVSYRRFKGPIPDGLAIDHKCRVRCCVNPDHLEVVTIGENVRRGLTGVLWVKPTHCKRGHEYNESNSGLYLHRGRIERICRACAREKYHENKPPLRYPRKSHAIQ